MSEHFSTAPAGTEPAEVTGASSDGPAGDGIAVDLTAFLVKAAITSPSASLTPSVDDDETAMWHVADSNGSFMPSPELLAGAEIALLVRTPVTREPAWQVLLRNQLQIGGLTILPASSSGAILFVRTVSSGKEQFVAWCFGQGSRWLRRQATTPRFGLLAALNAINDSAEPASPEGVGVVGASLAARDGNLRRANLTAAVPTTADAIPRIDTLADMLVAARINTGNEVLGRVAAGRSLQFSAFVASVAAFQRLSDLVVELAGQDGYRRSHGWIDHIVPETDDSVIEGVLERIWRGTDDQGRPIDVEIAWWEDPRDSGSDHPVTHWRLAAERKQKHPVRNLALTWAALKRQLARRLGPAAGHVALRTDVRFFSDSEEALGRCPLIDLLSAELTVDGITYVLADGEISRVDADFLAALEADLQQRVVPSTLIPYRPGELEGNYNERAARTRGMLMLDKTDIRPSGMSQIEPCDLLGRDGTLCHVKRHTTATGISHLANQGVASATVLLRRAESRDKLAGLIEDRAWDPSSKRHVQEDLGRMATTQTRLPVSFAIIGEWTNPAIRNLSLLSRIALRTATQKLTDLGFPAQIMLIGREPN